MSKVQNLVTTTENEYVQDIIHLIDKFVDKYGDVALSCGSEWMYQNNEAQVDALDLVGNILDVLQDFAENED